MRLPPPNPLTTVSVWIAAVFIAVREGADKTNVLPGLVRAMSGTFSYLPLGVLLLAAVVYLVNLWRAQRAPLLAGEAPSPSLPSHANAPDAAAMERAGRRDITISEGVCWIVFRRWGLTVQTDGGGHLDHLVAAIDEVRQAALDGNVHIWGKINRSGVHHRILPAFWSDNRIEHASIYDPNPIATAHTACEHLRPRERYMDLMASRAEFESEWTSLV